jgi:hypothetical protein
MRTDLFTHPKVVRISSALKADTLRTVGGLMQVWSLFDAHSTDGKLDGYTPDMVNDLLRWPGFCEQMMRVGWMFHEGGEVLALPDFEAHNGASAKRRAQDSDRKKIVRKMSALKADTCPQNVRSREEGEDIDQDQELSPPGGGDGDFRLEPERTDPKLNGHAKPNPVPFQAIVDLYHQICCPPLPRVFKLTEARKGHIRQRWQNDLPTMEDWQDYFIDVRESAFLTGQKPGTNGRPPFLADFDYLLSPSNFAKIAEGKYHR